MVYSTNLYIYDIYDQNLLAIDAASAAFMAFLKTEYGEAQLEFYLEV
jgi:hypothetical protein